MLDSNACLRDGLSAGFADSTHNSGVDWSRCRFLTCSVLPVRVACNLHCKFCFSKSSISALRHEKTDWSRLPVDDYYRWSLDHGATRLVITGGGEPLLKPRDVLHLIQTGQSYFPEITCFTNGAYLTSELTSELVESGLSYICFSRHHEVDERNLELMGRGAPTLNQFFAAAKGLRVRATCVMAAGYVDSVDAVWSYINALRHYGVREFTFKHTYVAYEDSVFRGSAQDHWAEIHQIEFDPFTGQGEIIGSLPWGPDIRRIRDFQVCYYREPTPAWERRNRICRSTNLLSDGKVYASLEDQQSLLYQLRPSQTP